MNTLVITSVGSAFRASSHHYPGTYQTIAWTIATSICIIGVNFLFGTSDRPPSQG
jgi:hypothetical protein